jgi:hypothetical protein
VPAAIVSATIAARRQPCIPCDSFIPDPPSQEWRSALLRRVRLPACDAGQNPPLPLLRRGTSGAATNENHDTEIDVLLRITVNSMHVRSLSG